MWKINKRNLKFVVLSIVLLGLNVTRAYALTPSPLEVENTMSAFRKVSNMITLDDILVPTVVEVPLQSQYFDMKDFLIYDYTNSSYVPYYYKEQTSSNIVHYNISTRPVISQAYKMNDNIYTTFAEFEYVEKNEKNSAEIIIKGLGQMRSSAFRISLANNVALPNTIEIQAKVNGRDKIVLAETKMISQTMNFPSTMSDEWTVKLSYGQPLRINEVKLLQEDYTSTSKQDIRFLAQPNHDYKIFMDPDRKVYINAGESGNLRSDEDVKVLAISYSFSFPNSSYEIADIDKDGHPDITDNCVSISNPDQKDLNNNGRGDVCDDFDKDGIMNDKDNCPNSPNRAQLDADRDGLGDECDVEESRITEKYKWIPWAGIVFALLVIIILFFITARTKDDDIAPPTQ